MVALALGEVMARVAGPPAPSTGAGPRLYQFDTLLGWSKRPDVEVRMVNAEWDVVVSTNEHGQRGPSTPLAKPEGTTRVLLLGDSYLEAYTVADAEMVSTALERRLDGLVQGDFEVLNGGTAGYATDQELLYFARDGAAFQPDVTVLLFYVNDVWFNGGPEYWRGAKPYFAIADTLELRGVPVPALAFGSREWSERITEASALYRLVRGAVTRGAARSPGSDDENEASVAPAVPADFRAWQRTPDAETAARWRVTEALLVELRDRARAAGSRFVVFWVPSKAAVHDDVWGATREAYRMSDEAWSPTADADMLRAICGRASLECLVPLEEFRARSAALGEPGALYFPIDGHWTAAGHALAAEVLASALAEGS